MNDLFGRLPARVRRALKVSEGDYLDAELIEGGVILKPVTVVDREAAWREIDAARAGVRLTAERSSTVDLPSFFVLP